MGDRPRKQCVRCGYDHTYSPPGISVCPSCGAAPLASRSSVEGHRVEGPRHGLRELAEQATPGPWRHVGSVVAGHQVDGVYGGEAGETQVTRWPREADARLIALAPELAVLLADAKDALVKLSDADSRGAGSWTREGESAMRDMTDALDAIPALLARIEELEGKAWAPGHPHR